MVVASGDKVSLNCVEEGADSFGLQNYDIHENPLGKKERNKKRDEEEGQKKEK